MKHLRQIDSLDSAPVGYYWLAIEDDPPPRIVAVIEGPRGKAIMAIGVTGNSKLPEQRCRLYGPLTCPSVPPWGKPRKEAK